MCNYLCKSTLSFVVTSDMNTHVYMVVRHVFKAGSKQPHSSGMYQGNCSFIWLNVCGAVLLYCNLSCLLAILHCTAFLEPAPLNFASGCKIKRYGYSVYFWRRCESAWHVLFKLWVSFLIGISILWIGLNHSNESHPTHSMWHQQSLIIIYISSRKISNPVL